MKRLAVNDANTTPAARSASLGPSMSGSVVCPSSVQVLNPGATRGRASPATGNGARLSA